MSLWKRIGRAEQELDSYKDIGLSVFLTVLLILSFGIFPFVDLHELSGRLVSLGFTGLFLAGSLIGDLGRGSRRVVLGLAIAGAVLTWVPATASEEWLWICRLAVSIVFILVISVALLRQVFRPGEINWHRFRGATAVYVLMGFLLALGFVLLEGLAPGSFDGWAQQPRDHQIRDAVYFSFVTLTTLGYGDITPIGEGARNLAVVEALIGQIFLAILIGRLVTLSGQTEGDH
ncbi:MAG: ion channel [Thermoanaerobaculia bacterium]|nr:ion channel [Thermoanaerobaculia bacterium]